MALGQIPWSATLHYAQHNQLDASDTESLIDLIERLDNHELTKLAEETKRNGQNGTPKRRD